MRKVVVHRVIKAATFGGVAAFFAWFALRLGGSNGVETPQELRDLAPWFLFAVFGGVSLVHSISQDREKRAKPR